MTQSVQFPPLRQGALTHSSMSSAQRSPRKPAKHTHIKPFTRSWHTPPLLHGSERENNYSYCHIQAYFSSLLLITLVYRVMLLPMLTFCARLTWLAVVNVVLAQISGESGVAAALVSTAQVLTHPSVSARIPHTLVNVHLTRLTCVVR